MSLQDIEDLPEDILPNQEGHIEDTKKMVRGLKTVKSELEGRLSDTRVLRPERRQLVPVARRAEGPFVTGGGLSTAVLGGVGIVRVKILATTHGVRLVFTNWYNASGNEADNTVPITVGPVDIEPDVTPRANRRMPVWFNGSRKVVIPPGGQVVSDVVGVSFKKGDRPWVFTYVTVESGGFPLTATPSAADNEGHMYANPAGSVHADGVSVTSPATTTRVYGPSAILGPTLKPTSVLGILTDSIGSSYTDAKEFVDHGWILRALADDYPYIRAGLAGTTAAAWTTSGGWRAPRRKALAALTNVTHWLIPLGTNDINTGSGFAASQTALIAMWTERANTGMPIAVCTLPPITTSADTWATAAGQTASDNEAARVSMNTWLRDGAPIATGGVAAATGSNAAGTVRIGQVGHPVSLLLEVADAVETARNSGLWKTYGRIVTDGAMTVGSNVVTSATAAFTASDTGRRVLIDGAGPDGAAVTGVATYESPTTVTLRNVADTAVVNASTAVSGARTVIGFSGVVEDGVHPSGKRGVNDPGGHELIATAIATPLREWLGGVTA